MQIKTKETSASALDYINAIKDQTQREDSLSIMKLMQKVSGDEPKMWGASMIGFGNKRYKSATTGREVDWFKIGFAPRKNNLSLHLAVDVQKYASLLKKLGKHKTGSGCLYINKVSDIDLKLLEELIRAAVKTK